MFIEPVLLMSVITCFNMTSTSLGLLMIGLSLFAFLCQSLRRNAIE